MSNTARRTAAGLALGLSLAVAGCGSAATAPSHAGAPSKSPTTTSTSSAAAFFRGKTITLIAPDKPGGGYDRWARLVAPYLEKELGAKVDVVNIPAAGTIAGTNQLYEAKPDGLTLGMVNAAGDIGNLIEKVPGQKFDLTRFTYLAQPTANVVGVFAATNSPYKSLSDLLHAKSPVRILDIRSGTGDLTNRVILKALGVPMQLVTGYSSGKSMEAGFLRGDGPVASITYSSWRTLVHAGKARVLLVTVLSKHWSRHPNIPTLGDEIATQKLSASAKAALTTVGKLLSVAYDFAAPPGLSAAKTAVLRKAFADILHNPQFIKQAEKAGLTVEYTPGATVAKLVQETIAHSSSLVPYLK